MELVIVKLISSEVFMFSVPYYLMNVLTVAYLIFGCLVGLVSGFNYLLTKHYTHPSEAYSLATLTTTLSFSVTLLSVLLVPVDILAASGLKEIPQTNIGTLFLLVFGSMMFLAFCLIPFAYFYGEEDLESETLSEKLCESLKHTAGFMLVCCILIIVGLLFRPEKEDWGEGKEWVKKLFDLEHTGEAVVSFTVACLTLVGLVFWCFYTAFGMAQLPFTLVKGTKSLEEARTELDYDLSEVREQIRQIELRSTASNTRLTRKEKKQKAHLEKLQKQLTKKSERMTEKQRDNFQAISKVLKLLTPFRVALGVLTMVLSVIFFFSLFFGSVNKLVNSTCGFSCGFLTTKFTVLNPLDELLVLLSNYFPLDYLLFGVFVVYIYIASLYGLVTWGLRVCWVLVFEVRKKQTMPQALLVLSVVMMFVFLGICAELLSVLPGYVTFGSQTYTEEGQLKQCSLENFSEVHCTMSNISVFFNK